MRLCVMRVCVLRVCVMRVCVMRVCVMRVCVLRVCAEGGFVGISSPIWGGGVALSPGYTRCTAALWGTRGALLVCAGRGVRPA